MGTPQTNKIPASLDLTGANAQFSEQGDQNIVSEVFSSTFNQYFESSLMKYAYYCDFTERHRWPTDTIARNIVALTGVDKVLFSGLILPGFLGTELTPGNRGYITQFVPYAICRTMSGARTPSYNMRLLVYDSTNTIIGRFGGSGQPPASNGYYLSPITAGVTVPAGDGGGGGTIVYSTDVRYKLVFTALTENVYIDVFGLLYNVGVL